MSTTTIRLPHARLLFGAASVLSMLVSPMRAAYAQSPVVNVAEAERPWAIRFTSGAMVPTGPQRDAFKDAQLSAMQLSWRVLPSLAVTGAFSWARSRVIDVANGPKVDVFTSDVGVETRTSALPLSDVLSIRPFAGVGGGVRTYNYRVRDVDASNHAAGYLAVGSDVDIGRVGVRLEARDYVSRFAPRLNVGSTTTRNDVLISVGLQLNKRRASQQ